LVYAINSPLVRKQAEEKSKGATRLRINLSEVKKLIIPLPSIEIQNKIIEKLDYVLGQLEEKKKQILHIINAFDSEEIHKTYQNHLLKLAFSGALTNRKQKYDQVEVGSTYTEIKSKWNPSNELGMVNFIGLKNIESNTGRLINFKPTDTSEIKSTKSFFKKTHVLYGKLRPNLNKVILPEFDGVCSTDILVLDPNEKIIREYLAYFLKSDLIVSKMDHQ